MMRTLWPAVAAATLALAASLTATASTGQPTDAARATHTTLLSSSRVMGVMSRMSAERAVVHTTAGDIETTPEHPFYVPGRGWTPASRLSANTLLQTPAGTTITTAAADVTPVRLRPVFNLIVEGPHVYFAGAVSALVHNGTCSFQPVSSPLAARKPARNVAQRAVRASALGKAGAGAPSRPDALGGPIFGGADRASEIGLTQGMSRRELVAGDLAVIKQPDVAVFEEADRINHPWVEHLCNRIYDAAGISVPDTAVIHSSSGTAFMSKYIPNLSPVFRTTADNPGADAVVALTKAQKVQLASGRAIDRLVGARDLHADNLLKTPAGDIVRIDNGSALGFKGTGLFAGNLTYRDRGVDQLVRGLSEREIENAERRALVTLDKSVQDAGGWEAFVEKSAPGLNKRVKDKYNFDLAAQLSERADIEFRRLGVPRGTTEDRPR